MTLFTESAFGPLRSSSRDVHMLFVPSHRNFFQGLSLALRSHGQFQAGAQKTNCIQAKFLLSAKVRDFPNISDATKRYKV